MRAAAFVVALGPLWLGATLGTARASEISDLYSDKCSVCHGDDGKGHTRMGKKFHSPDFTKVDWQAQAKDDEILRAIENGVVVDGQHRMPAWKEKLTPKQIGELAKYTRAFAKQ